MLHIGPASFVRSTLQHLSINDTRLDAVSMAHLAPLANLEQLTLSREPPYDALGRVRWLPV